MTIQFPAPPPPVKPTGSLIGGCLLHDGGCCYCPHLAPATRDARDRMAALIADLAPSTAPARRRLAALISPWPTTNRPRP